MRIGFDISATGACRTGCGQFADSLIRELVRSDETNEYLLYAVFGPASYHGEGQYEHATRVDGDRATRVLEGVGYVDAVRLWSAPPPEFEQQLGEPDIVHSNNFYCPTFLRSARLVYTLHDLTPVDRADAVREDNRMSSFHGLFDASVHADAIVAVSDFSRGRFLEFFPHYPGERVFVVHEASRFDADSPATPPARPVLERDSFWLHVGTIEPRKNLRRLIEAYALLRREGATAWPLVLAGARGWEEGLADLVRERGLEEKVHLLGYVSDEELVWLYRNCGALVLPSTYEGFGLPLIEAMSQGAPTIASASTSLSEVGGTAFVPVRAESTETIVEAMRRVGSRRTLREELRRRSRDRADRFSWTKAAKEVLDVYEWVSESPRLRDTAE